MRYAIHTAAKLKSDQIAGPAIAVAVEIMPPRQATTNAVTVAAMAAVPTIPLAQASTAARASRGTKNVEPISHAIANTTVLNDSIIKARGRPNKRTHKPTPAAIQLPTRLPHTTLGSAHRSLRSTAPNANKRRYKIT